MVNIKVDTKKAHEAGMNALMAQAILLKGRSQALCPVDTGTLRNSCVIEQKNDEIIVGYGGAASSYAAIQHENLSFHHNVGQAKYLEQPATEMEEEIKAAVEKAVVGALK
jgi:hypothetical protein